MDDSPQFTTIVDRIEQKAEGVRSIIVVATGPDVLPGWEPGAHIDVVLPGGLIRQFSLCGDPADTDQWRFAVLREPESRGGSSWLHEQLEEGDELIVRGPRNNFALVDADTYIFVAGGIGVTPLIPMIREVEARGRNWRLTYGGREPRIDGVRR